MQPESDFVDRGVRKAGAVIEVGKTGRQVPIRATGLFLRGPGFDAGETGFQSDGGVEGYVGEGGREAVTISADRFVRSGIISQKSESHEPNEVHADVSEQNSEYHTDHDGRLSLAEELAGTDAQFAEMDTNHDGKVTPEERRAAMMRSVDQIVPASTKSH